MVRVVGTRPGGIPEAWGQAGVNLECCQARDRWGCPWVDREMESGYPGVLQVRCTPALAPSTRKRGVLLGSGYVGVEPWRPAWGGGEWVPVQARTGM